MAPSVYLKRKKSDIERVQKVACKIILNDRYQGYDHALSYLNLQKLTDRRTELCLRFAKKCLLMDKTRSMFPLNPAQGQDNLRHTEKYFVEHAATGRLKDSAIPQMQRALNMDAALK